MTQEKTKICSKCKKEKLHSFFSKNARLKSGLKSQCKECVSEFNKKNREKQRDYDSKYREKNKNLIKEKYQAYCEKNAEKIAIQKKSYKEINKTKISIYEKKYREENREKRIEALKDWRKRNAEKIKSYSKNYNLINKEKRKELNRKWIEKNREKRRLYSNNLAKKKLQTDFLYGLKKRIKCRISESLRKNGYTKKSKTYEILGCDYETFAKHIESQFKDGMSRENRNEWHIDHIIPLALAKTEEDVIRLNHYTNLQPLWAMDNIMKADKLYLS